MLFPPLCLCLLTPPIRFVRAVEVTGNRCPWESSLGEMQSQEGGGGGNLHFFLSALLPLVQHTRPKRLNPFSSQKTKRRHPGEPKHTEEIIRMGGTQETRGTHVLWTLGLTRSYSARLDVTLFSRVNTATNEQTTSQDPDEPLGGAHAGQTRVNTQKVWTLKGIRIIAHRTRGLTRSRSTDG